MKINYTNNTIELTKAEAKAAGVISSDAYKALMEIRVQNPTFKVTVVVAPTKKTSKKNQITYADIERYISFHDDAEGSIMSEYKARRNAKENGELYNKSFFEIKKWFFETYPEVA